MNQRLHLNKSHENKIIRELILNNLYIAESIQKSVDGHYDLTGLTPTHMHACMHVRTLHEVPGEAPMKEARYKDSRLSATTKL